MPSPLDRFSPRPCGDQNCSKKKQDGSVALLNPREGKTKSPDETIELTYGKQPTVVWQCSCSYKRIELLHPQGVL